MGSMQLLFCNTFNYEAQGTSSKWAVIKFPCMVAVDLIRILSPGVQTHSQLHDDQCTGKTSPGKFRLDIFSDDRSAGMTTYEHVGYLDYSEAAHCEFRPLSALYSEKLLFNGWFNRLTIAVYGGILSDVGMPNPSLDLPTKAPSLVIHEKPEGRSVYIRGLQDLPKLTNELEKPEPLMASFPSNSKPYAGANENIGKRDVANCYGDNIINDARSSYYDRRQPRPRIFGNESGKIHQKNYAENRSDYSSRKSQHTDTDANRKRNDFDDRNYKEKNRQHPSNQRHVKQDNSENPGSKQCLNVQSEVPVKFPSETRYIQSTDSPKPSGSTEAEESDANPEWVDAAEFEEISEEETEEERFSSIQDMDDIIESDDMSVSGLFNPFLIEPVQLMHFSHPGMSEFEVACNNLLTEDEQALSQSGNEENSARFESLVTKAKRVGKIKMGQSVPILILGGNEGKDWVAVIEEIIPLVTVALPSFGVTSREKYDEYLSFLVASVFTGLDMGMISKQSIGINLRMLKCGINLAQKLCQTTQDIVAFLSVGGLDTKLVSLLKEDNMASSIKIMIVHTLDAYLSWPCAVAPYFHDGGKSNITYLNLVELILVPQAARVAAALSRLMNKISLFHAMWKLRTVVQELAESKVPLLQDEFDFDDDFIGDEVIEEDDAMGVDDDEIMVTSSVDIHHDTDSLDNPIQRQFATAKSNERPEYESFDIVDPISSAIYVEEGSLCQDIGTVRQCLNLILRTFEDISGTITQLPKRAFPTTTDICDLSEMASASCMFRMLEYYNVIPSIQILLSLPYISGNQSIYESSYGLLDFLMSKQSGLVFLAFNSTSICCLVRHLLSSSELSDIENTGTAPHLGAKLAFHMQCIQCVDQLKVLSESTNEDVYSSEQSTDVLRVLYSLTYPTYGKYWTAHVLSLDDNIQAILTFVQQVKEEEPKAEAKSGDTEEKGDKKADQTKKKSVRKTAAGGFASNILLLTLKMSQNVSYVLRHRQSIQQTVQDAPVSRAIEEIHEWLRPLENVKNNSETIGQLMQYLKSAFPKLEWNTLMTTGPGLCTALRILGVSVEADKNSKASCKKLQSALQMYGGGGLTVLAEGMERLNKCYEYPCYTQHALTTVFSFNFHNLVTALSDRMLVLINHLLSALLSTSDGKVDPNILTKLLVEHYAGIYVILRGSDQTKLNTITHHLTSIYALLLKKCTAPEMSSDIKEANHRTVALQQILSASQQHCQNFAPGLTLLSQLLPMPLPIVSPYCKDHVISSVKSQRNLWASSLNPVMTEFTSVIKTLCTSTCIPLLEIVIPLIQQVADLSAALARAMITAVIDACVVSEVIPTGEPDKESQEPAEVRVSFRSHPLMVLAEVGSSPPAKAALLEHLRSDENKLKLLWITAKNQAKSGSPYLLDAAIKLISVLVDPENNLVPKSCADLNSDILPSDVLADMLKLCCIALESVSLSTLIDCMYCLYFLCMINECFQELKDALSANETLLYDLLAVLVKAWAKDPESACIVLIGLCELMRCLTLPQQQRTSSLSKLELKTFLKWGPDFNRNHHPFSILKNRIEESYDLELSEVLNQVSILYDNLQSSCEFRTKSRTSKHSPNTNAYVSLEEQFESRPWHVLGDDDHIFCSRINILQGNAESSMMHHNIQRVDKTKVDLVDVAEKNCSGFNLEKSFNDLTDSAKTTDIDKIRIEAKAKRLKKLETFSTRHGKTLTYIKRSHGLLMTGPRGRGRGHGPSVGRQNDLFRQRKQNTSRPPSMHVDDFIAADEEDINSTTSDAFVLPVPAAPTFSTRRPPSFKRDFVPRGRGARGMARNGSRGNYSFVSMGGAGDPIPGIDKFRSRTVGSHPSDRFVRGRGRGRDPTRSFTPRDGFKPKPSWNFSGQRNVSLSSGGFRGGRVKSLMGIGRPLLPQPPLNMKWNGMPPRRGRGGYSKPRGKHLRSFTR